MKFFVMAMVEINCTRGWVLGNVLEKQLLQNCMLEVSNVTRLPLKQPSGVGVWSRYGKKLKLAAKICLTYKKPILNVICKNGK